MAEKPLKTASAGSEVGKKRMREEKAAKAEEPTAQKAKTTAQHGKTISYRVELKEKEMQQILEKALKEALPSLKYVAYVAFWKPWSCRGLFASAAEAQKAIHKGSVQALGETLHIAKGAFPEEVNFEGCRSWFAKQVAKASGIDGVEVQTGDRRLIVLSTPAEGNMGTVKLLNVAGITFPVLSNTTPFFLLETDLSKFLTSVVKKAFPNAVKVVPLRFLKVKVTFASEQDVRAVYEANPVVLQPRRGDSPTNVELSCEDYVLERVFEVLAPLGAAALGHPFQRVGSGIPFFVSTEEAAQKLEKEGTVNILGHSFTIKRQPSFKIVAP